MCSFVELEIEIINKSFKIYAEQWSFWCLSQLRRAQVFLPISADAERILAWVWVAYIYQKQAQKQRSACEKCRSHRKYRWFLDLGESTSRHNTVDEQFARKLGWIMGGLTQSIYIYIYIYGFAIFIYWYLCIYLYLFTYVYIYIYVHIHGVLARDRERERDR